MVKRIFDLAAGLTLLLLTFPLLLLIGIGIVIESRGGVFSLQPRVGRGGKFFKIILFRTELANAASSTNGAHSASQKERTSFGRVLHHFRLDELPQLFNVLRGDMSIVGPRARVPEMVKLFTPEQRRLLQVRPGIIGPSRIYCNSDVSQLGVTVKEVEANFLRKIVPQKIAHDLAYIDNHNFFIDLRLLSIGLGEFLSRILRAEMVKQGKGYTLLLPADMLSIVISYSLAYQLRFEWHIPDYEREIFLTTLPVLLIVRILCFVLLFPIYNIVWKYFSAKDFIKMARACTFGTVCMVAITFFIGPRGASRSVFIIEWLCLILVMSGIRALPRLFSQPKEPVLHRRRNALIVGAGDLGEILLRDAMKQPQFEYEIVGFVDDNPAKLKSYIHGVRILGKCKDIPVLVEQYRIDEVLIAISNISPSGMKDILRLCRQAKIKHKIVPGVKDLLSGKVHLSKIREVTVDDLLGHRPIELDISAIGNLLRDKVILVTGAGGSIGSELCRQIAAYSPQQLICLDRTENYLAEIQNDFARQFPELDVQFSLCDITDARRLQRLFREHRPQIVFHAAAFKHVPVCELNPDDAVINNVYGTMQVANTASEYGCGHFIMISTDKAVNATSVMGCTKRIAELYVQSFSRQSQTRFMTVRFGNVLHSHGSVVPLFMKQIEHGGPVTVTHPEIERFFMSISEAVQLVLQAVTMGKSGEIFVLDMGKPVRILDLAHELIRRAGLEPEIDIEITMTGLRPGEKLYEELINEGEQALPTYHNRIQTLKSVMRDYDEIHRKVLELCELAKAKRFDMLFEKMKEIDPQYKTWSHKTPETRKVTASMSKENAYAMQSLLGTPNIVKAT
jgi:FlaA1/EpsC-like NDP-sugar epimerase/lipopolysaccharide/colanic/teichoic acid biosynthesis glycosyltransferase